jgi:murein DD-endopeptidase MepM/ murein hydrolase activator NlpD
MRVLAVVAAAASGLLLLGSRGLTAPVAVAHAGAVSAGVVQGAVVTQGFGCTPFALEPAAPWCGTGHFHSGIDLAAPLGTPVFADADGVATVIAGATGYGLHVILRHDLRTVTLYGHLSSVAVAEGDWLVAGQQVGSIGSTGMSTGPHLHFEVRVDGRPVDPAAWLAAGPRGGGD